MKAIKSPQGWIIELTAEDIAEELLKQHKAYGCASGAIYGFIWDAIRRRYPKREVTWNLEGVEYGCWRWRDKQDEKLREWFYHNPLHYKGHIFQYMSACADLPTSLGIWDE